MDAVLRFLTPPVHLRPAGPRARRVPWLLLAGWVLLHAADWAMTAALLMPRDIHEDYPLQAALLAHSGVVALTGYNP
jgi:hypothetical protein